MAALRSEALFHGTVDEVAALLLDPAFLEADALDHDATAVEVLVDGTTTTVRSRVATDAAPGVIKKLLPGDIGIKEVTEWSGPTGKVSVAIMGGRGTMVGDVTLEAAEGGTVCRVVGEVTASVPLVGGKLAQAAVGVIGDAMRHRCALGNKWLQRRDS